MALDTKRILVLCTGNSCRSQMAEAFLRRAGFQAASAGTNPKGLDPNAVQVMAEVGIDIAGGKSQSVDDYRGETFDTMITVCDDAREACPVFPGARRQLHWPFDDPPATGGTQAERLAVYRRVRDEIHARVEAFSEQQEI